ncbi:MAG TPA: cupin domain-containing protein [Chitinophagaceae bacterium]|jgi:quercetin dioxygenase-like cupin family protein
MKKLSTTLFVAISVVMLCCNCNQPTNTKTEGKELQSIFPKGELGALEYFTGKAWNISLVQNDTIYNTLVGNVYFEPGARSNWHIHPAGQILIITDGVGYHQIKGQPKQTLHKGDVVKCPPNVEHWHGASPDSGLQQMYILSKTEKGIVQWLQPVTDAEYQSSK